jgi:hypothetical protein
MEPRYTTPSVLMNKTFKKSSKINFDQTIEKIINNYRVISILYENIFHGLSNDINFIIYMLMMYSINLVKMYIV